MHSQFTFHRAPEAVRDLRIDPADNALVEAVGGVLFNEDRTPICRLIRGLDGRLVPSEPVEVTAGQGFWVRVDREPISVRIPWPHTGRRIQGLP